MPRFSSVQWALCVPDDCSASDVDLGVKETLGSVFNGTEVRYKVLVEEQMCQSAERGPWSTSTVIGL